MRGLDVCDDAHRLGVMKKDQRPRLSEAWTGHPPGQVTAIGWTGPLPRMCYIVLMASTRSATLSIRLKPETKRRLAKLAKNSGRSSNFLISDAVDSYVAEQEMLAAEIRQGNRQVAAGHYIRHEDMKAWLLSWGTDRELPVPKCACGKEHDDETLCR